MEDLSTCSGSDSCTALSSGYGLKEACVAAGNVQSDATTRFNAERIATVMAIKFYSQGYQCTGAANFQMAIAVPVDGTCVLNPGFTVLTLDNTAAYSWKFTAQSDSSVQVVQYSAKDCSGDVLRTTTLAANTVFDQTCTTDARTDYTASYLTALPTTVRYSDSACTKPIEVLVEPTGGMCQGAVCTQSTEADGTTKITGLYAKAGCVNYADLASDTATVMADENTVSMLLYDSKSTCADTSFLAAAAFQGAKCVRNLEALTVFPIEGGATATAWKASYVTDGSVKIRSYTTTDCSDEDPTLVVVDTASVTKSTCTTTETAQDFAVAFLEAPADTTAAEPLVSGFQATVVYSSSTCKTVQSIKYMPVADLETCSPDDTCANTDGVGHTTSACLTADQVKTHEATAFTAARMTSVVDVVAYNQATDCTSDEDYYGSGAFIADGTCVPNPGLPVFTVGSTAAAAWKLTVQDDSSVQVARYADAACAGAASSTATLAATDLFALTCAKEYAVSYTTTYARPFLATVRYSDSGCAAPIEVLTQAAASTAASCTAVACTQQKASDGTTKIASLYYSTGCVSYASIAKFTSTAMAKVDTVSLMLYDSKSTCADASFVAAAAFQGAKCVRNLEALKVFPATDGAIECTAHLGQVLLLLVAHPVDRHCVLGDWMDDSRDRVARGQRHEGCHWRSTVESIGWLVVECALHKRQHTCPLRRL